jgi:hypothetical protein
LHVNRRCPEINGLFEVGRPVIQLRVALGNPLELSTPFLPVAGQDLHDILARVGDEAVDAVFLDQLQGVQHLLLGVVVAHERRHIVQIT